MINGEKTKIVMDPLYIGDMLIKDLDKDGKLKYISTHCSMYGAGLNLMPGENIYEKCWGGYELSREVENTLLLMELIRSGKEKTEELLIKAGGKIEYIWGEVEGIMDKTAYTKGLLKGTKDMLVDTVDSVAFVGEVLSDEIGWVVLKVRQGIKSQMGKDRWLEDEALRIARQELMKHGVEINENIELMIEIMKNLHILLPLLVEDMDAETAGYMTGYIGSSIVMMSALSSVTGGGGGGVMVKNVMGVLNKVGYALKGVVNVGKLVKNKRLAEIIIKISEDVKRLGARVDGIKASVWLELGQTAKAAKIFVDKIVSPYRWNWALVEDLPEEYIIRVSKDIEVGRIIDSEKKFFTKVGEEGIDTAEEFFGLGAKEYVEAFVKENMSKREAIDGIESVIDIWKIRFKSYIRVSKDGKRLVIKDVRRGELEDDNIRMSDVIYEQIRQLGVKTDKMKIIELENVVNKEILEIINKYGIKEAEKIIKERWGEIGGLDRMVNKFAEKVGKKIEKIEVNSMLVQDMYGLEMQYFIYITLK